MNARLLIINPHQTKEPPFAPTLILEQNGNLVLLSAGWPQSIKRGSLSDLTVEDLRNLPGLRAEDTILLSEMRSLPTEDLRSEELLSSTRTWWTQFTAEQALRIPIAKAS